MLYVPEISIVAFKRWLLKLFDVPSEIVYSGKSWSKSVENLPRILRKTPYKRKMTTFRGMFENNVSLGIRGKVR